MRNIIIIVFLSCFFNVAGQISEGGMPYSYYQTQLKTQVSVPEYKLKKLNDSKLKEEDSENPTPFRYSIFEEVNVDIKTGVTSEINEPKGTIWRYSIASEKAYSIQIVFQTFHIPSGAKLFIYNNDYSVIYGAFTKQNTENDKSFTVADFPGQNLIIEYFEPLDAEFKGTVKIGHLGQSYQDILQLQEEKAQENTFIDVNCDEGKNWQTEKHAVCKITFRIGNSGYLCSGALINNTANDGTPYFLTANHCIDDTAVAKTLIVYFNYEKRSCGGSLENYKTLAGSQLMSTGTKSDYTLLKLNTSPPVSYMPFYSGWDIGNYQDNQNTSIHHPQGIEKKISIDYDKIVNYDFAISWNEGGSTPPLSHWLVNFDKGLTSEGSSGGPLFSKQKRIIGQLHGGSDNDEFYGKLSFSWANNNTGIEPLKTYLDPSNSGVTFLNGYFPSTNPPDAFFTTSFTSACLNFPVNLFEHSAFTPTSRTWTITPSTFTYVNSTNRNSPNPQVQFTSPGSYTIKLNVANNSGKDSLQLSNAISAGNNINVSLTSSLGNSLCYSNFDSLILTGYGAETFSWSIGSPSPGPFNYSRTEGDTAILRKQNNVTVDSTYSLKVNVTGTMGTCSDTAQQTITFVKASNDNIANAIEIGLGRSKSYSNLCATIEANEPIPPTDSCTGLKSWCDEYGTGEDIVENSVWFKFKGPATGKAGLKSSGFDNEIAIYEANSYQDILNGLYTLLGANDDESDTNPNPTIPEIIVQAGKTYWVQVDGSGGGSEGTFTLTLSDRNITATPEIKEDNSITVYPQPVSDLLTIKGNFNNSSIDIKIYSLSGQLYMETAIYKGDENEITIDTRNLSPGTYLLKITQNNTSTVKKLVKN